MGAGVGLVVSIAAGFRLQRTYLGIRYGNNPAYAWANTVHDERIAFTFNGFPLWAHQYGLTGDALDNHVQWVGRPGQDGEFHSVRDCREWRRALRDGRYRYVAYGRNRDQYADAVSPVAWTADDPAAEPVVRERDWSVYRLDAPPDPTRCASL